MKRLRLSPTHSTLIYATASGMAWGIALARALALEAHLPTFIKLPGVILSALLSGILAYTLAKLRFRKEHSGILTAAQLTPLWLPLVDILSGNFQPWRGPVLLMGSLGLVTLTQTGLPGHWGLILAIGLPLLIYIPDLSPYVGRADTFEFQVTAPRLGIAHPSGYPLYVLIGKLFSLLPFDLVSPHLSVAWRVNLSSAVFASLTSGVLFLALTEAQEALKPAFQKRERPPNNPVTNHVALLTALALAFSPTLWSRAVEAEVYTLNAFIVALGLWLAVRWADQRLSVWQVVPLFALLTGVAMTSHLTLGALLLLGGPLLLTSRPRPSFRLLSSALGLFMAGLSIYLYIPLRWPAINQGEIMTAAHFLRFVTNADSGGALHPLAFIQDPTRWGLVFRLLKMQIGWLGLFLSLWGLGKIFRWRPYLGLGTSLAFGAWVWFNLSFYVADPDYSAFLIPAHVMLMFWLGLGAFHLIQAPRPAIVLARLRQTPSSPTKPGILKLLQTLQVTWPHVSLSLLLLLPLSRLWLTGPTLNTADIGRADEAWGRYALQQPLAQDAVILADSEKFPPLYYLQQVEGLREDLDLIMLFNEAQYQEALQTRLEAGQVVYLARFLPGMGLYHPQSVGPLVEITPPPPSIYPTPENPEAHFQEHLILIKHRLECDPEGRAMHHLHLTWHVTRAITQDLSARLRLRTPTGDVAWARKETRPVNAYTTTQAWQQPGTRVSDYYALNWPTWLPPGEYTLDLGLFPRFAERGWAVMPGEGAWFPLETFTLSLHDNKGHYNHYLSAQFGKGIWLNGANLPQESPPGGQRVDVDMVWYKASREKQAKLENLSLVARWVQVEDQAHTASNLSPVLPLQAQGATYPPSTWPDRRDVTLRYQIPAPTESGSYRLDVGWQRFADTNPTLLRSHCKWLGNPRALCPVGEVVFKSSNAGTSQSSVANFANQILLQEVQLSRESLTPGDTLALKLHWRGLRDIEEDYTVFVQLIGPDGQLYGQVDTWPVQGTRPTSNWEPSTPIADPYNVPLDSNAPPGRYRVITGWYLLKTMERLPLVNEQGQAVGDFYTVGEITVP